MFVAEDSIDMNIGEVDSSLRLSEEGEPILTYTLGSLCKVSQLQKFFQI